MFVTGIGIDHPDPTKARAFIVAAREGRGHRDGGHRGASSATAAFKVKIDTDRWLGPEQASVRCDGEVVGTSPPNTARRCCRWAACITSPAGPEGKVASPPDDAGLGNKETGRIRPSTAARRSSSPAGRAPVINGVQESACASAAARRPSAFRAAVEGLVDEVIVVDDHITGVSPSIRPAKLLDMPPSGIRIRGKRSRRDATSRSPTRHRLGRHRHQRPAVHHRKARPGVALAGDARCF